MKSAAQTVTVPSAGLLHRLYVHRCLLAWVTSGSLLLAYAVLVVQVMESGTVVQIHPTSVSALASAGTIVVSLFLAVIVIFRWTGDSAAEASENVKQD